MATWQSESIYSMNPLSLPVGKLRDEDFAAPPNSFDQLFGDPRGTQKSTYDKHDKHTYTLPDAYWGRSRKLADTIERGIFLDDNFYTQVIAPWEVVEDANYVTWNEIKFNEKLTTPTPELGVVRLVSAKQKQNTASWTRWGIGYMMEHGFMNTPKGIQYHFEHLQQMASAALETAKFDVIFTLLKAHNIEKQWEIEFGHYNGGRLEDVIASDIWMFASLQKYKRPINELEVHVRETMSRWGGRADTWILPPAVINFAGIQLDEYLEYDKMGPLGPARVEDGPRPYGMIAQSRVYIARTYHTMAMTGRDNLLEHQREVGEYYKMFPVNPDYVKNYSSQHRSIKIYNEDNDQYHEIGLRWALENSYLFHQDTGLPIRLNDWRRYRHQLEGDDTEFDIWRYTDLSADNTTLQHYESELLGEMPLEFFNARDKLAWAGTARNAMRTHIGRKSFDTLESDFREGLDLLREIESIPFTDGVDKALYTTFALIDPTDDATVRKPERSPRPRDAISAVFNLPEFPQDATTGFLPMNTIDKLLPGMQSYAGLRALIVRGDAAALSREIEVARRFINAIDNFVGSAKQLALGSIFLDASHSSPWWHEPRDATTFFENLVMPYRPPLFMTNAAGVAVTVDTVGATTAAQVFNPVINRLKASAPDRLKIDARPAPDSRMAWLRYNLTVGFMATVNPDAPKATQNAIVGAFGGTPGRPSIFNFNTAWADNTDSGEVSAFASAMSKLGTDYPNAVDIGDTTVAQMLAAKQLEHFNRHWSEVQRATDNSPSLQFGGLETYYRTPLLVSPEFAASLAKYYRAGLKQTRVIPADPDFPEHVISREKLIAYTAHLPGSGANTNDRRAANTAESLSQINPAWQARIGEQRGDDDIESTSFMATSLQAHIGHSLDANDFGGSSIRSNIGSSAIPTAALTSSDQAMFPRRAAQAHYAKTTINPSLLPYEYRSDLSPALERHIGHGERMYSVNFRRSWAEINRIAPSPLDRALAHLYDGIPIRYEALENFISNDLVLPIGFYITRPHMTYRMLFGIKTQAGKETAMTLMKPGLFELGDDAATQAHIGTYTYYSKALVKNHNNVYIAKSIMCSGYDGGNGIRPIDPLAYDAADGHYGGQSIIVLATAYRDSNDGVMSLTGRLTLGEYAEYGLSLDNSLWYITAPRYNKLYGWNWARTETRWETQPFDGVVDRRFNNVLCHPGFQFYYDPIQEQFKIVTPGSGHFGGYTYQGCAAARRGQGRFKEQEWAGYTRM